MNKYCILSKNVLDKKVNKSEFKKTCIVLHLYYVDEMNENLKYVYNIPKEIDTYIITANEELKKIVEQQLNKRKIFNVEIILKLNRGRDFAALFIAAKDIIWKYEYVCFVHDKKSHKGDVKEYGEKWVKCFFENSIGSNTYIKNVVNLFNNNTDLGILGIPLPPEPYLFSRRGTIYESNYLNVVKILKKLNIKRNIDKSHTPITTGTCFWFRTDALKKIKKLNIQYDDFPNEPMPYDGSYAHALERVLEDIAISQGYLVKYVMNNEYAEYYLEETEKILDQSAIALREHKIIKYNAGKVDLRKSYYYSKKSDLIEYCKNNRRIFLIVDDNYALTRRCLSEIKKYRVNIDMKFSVDNINYSDIAAEPYFGIVVCTKKDINKISSKLNKLKLDYYIYK